ncbi:hypothetical protein ACFU9F_24785 [Streptomyces zhihengii]|uniref:hypothetical protein n=1 Tax=Streptomyces zhihengii TaxID=1818004 RepID=UPI0036C5F43F
MPTLLYYPLVTPPEPVLHQALLYWDGIASVVPEDPEVRHVALTPEMADLADRGLYRPLPWSAGNVRLIARSPAGGIGEAFEVLLEELRVLASQQEVPGRLMPLDRRLYSSKIGYHLEEEVVRLGLGRRVEAGAGGRWSLAVPREVQLLLVGAAARELSAGAGPDSAYMPYTDHASAHEMAVRPLERSSALAAWQVEIGRLLPVPAPGTPLTDVLVFRERYDVERRRLMSAVHALLAELRRNWEQPADVLAAMRDGLGEAVDDYHGAVRSSRLAWVRRGLAVTVGLAGAAAGALVVPDMDWLVGAVAGGYAINVAAREVRPLQRRRAEHPFAYLQHVRTVAR